MDIRMPRGGGSARSAILAFGAVAGAVWLISLFGALLIKPSSAARLLTLDLAGVTTLLMLAVVLPVMTFAWRGWWPGVALSVGAGILSVAALLVFATV